MTECDTCGGACCRYACIPIKNPTPDQVRWCLTRGTIEGDVWRIYAPCNYLKEDGKCSIYPSRPQVCVDYLMGSEPCKSAQKAWAKEKENA